MDKLLANLLANTSREAVTLRKAAIRFSEHIEDEPNDIHDLAGQRRNRDLLKAALAYAAVVKP